MPLICWRECSHLIREGEHFNFSSLIAGSEGTLAFVTSAKIKLTPLDPPHKKLVCIHCNSIDESLRANLVVLQHSPSAVELMDHYVFEATKRNRGQLENRFFIEGDPQAILVAELTRTTEESVGCRCKGADARFERQRIGIFISHC